jgi:hypothetical protein
MLNKIKLIDNLNDEGVKIETNGTRNVQSKIPQALSSNKYPYVSKLAKTAEGKQKILGFIWKFNSVTEDKADKLTDKSIQSSLEQLNKYLGNRESAQKDQDKLDSQKNYAGSFLNNAYGNWSDILWR